MTAPITAGTLIIKDTTSAASCRISLMRSTASVAPDRETPGRMENPWASPRMTISRGFHILDGPGPRAFEPEHKSGENQQCSNEESGLQASFEAFPKQEI